MWGKNRGHSPLNKLAVPQNVKCRLNVWPSNSTIRYIPQRNENTCPHKTLYTNGHSSIIRNRPQEKATQTCNHW